jgi:prepilin-type N-terminal cleavage/methylation domain-containing protein
MSDTVYYVQMKYLNPWNAKSTSLNKGFTIVELLIVIVVIAILAAITIVAYNGIQNRAYDTTIQSDLATIAKKIQSYRLTHADALPSTLSTAEVDITVSKSAYGNHYTPSSSAGYNLLYCRVIANPEEFAVIARSKSGKTFAVTHQTGPKEIAQVLTTTTTSCPDQGISSVGASWTFNNGVWAAGV